MLQIFQPQPICAVLCKNVLGELLNKAPVGLWQENVIQPVNRFMRMGKEGVVKRKDKTGVKSKSKKYQIKESKTQHIKINGQICVLRLQKLGGKYHSD